MSWILGRGCGGDDEVAARVGGLEFDKGVGWAAGSMERIEASVGVLGGQGRRAWVANSGIGGVDGAGAMAFGGRKG